MATPSKSFAVIGLGVFGSSVAEELVRFGNYVLGVDQDEKRVTRLASRLSEAVITDATDQQALSDLGIGKYDVVVVTVGEDLEASILCLMNARALGAKEIWVKANSRTHHRILAKLGADRIVHPEEEYGQHIAQMLHNPLVKDYVKLGNGFHVFNIEVSSRSDGKKLSAFELEKFELRALGVMRGSKYVTLTDGEAELKADDLLLVLGRRVDLRRFTNSLQ